MVAAGVHARVHARPASGPLARVGAPRARRLRPRPFVFPNLTLPLWHVEGLATFEESRAGEGVWPRATSSRSCGGSARGRVRAARSRERRADRPWPSATVSTPTAAFFHAIWRGGLAETWPISRGARPVSPTSALGRSDGALRRVARPAVARLLARLPARHLAQRGGAGDSSRWRGFCGPPHPSRLLVYGPSFDRDGTIVYSRR